jgi:cytochrome P450
MSSNALPRLDQDYFDPKILVNPVPFHEVLREAGPLFWIEKYNCYGTARYEEVRHVLKNWEQFSAARGVGLADLSKPGSWREAGPLVETDPPRHTDIRGVMTRIMSPRVIRSWREFLEKTVAALFDEVLSQREFDAVPQLSEAFIMAALPSILGIEVDRANLIIIGNHNFNSIGPNNEIFQATLAKLKAISAWYDSAATTEKMKPGGLGELVFQAEQRGELEPGLGYKLVRSLLRGGFDTTIAALGSLMMYFGKNPDEYERLRQNEKRIMNAFEEALRLEPPSQTFFRTINPGAELAGVKLEPDTKIQLWVSAANRDPRKWDEPARFKIDRDTAGILSFGDGVHRCLGQMVARLEAECFIKEFLKRVKKVELTAEPRYRLSNSLRTLDTLPLRVTLN